MLRALRAEADPSRVAVLQRFFRTGPGEYGEGDRFIGVTVPSIRMLARRFRDTPVGEIDVLLLSPIHEARLLAVVLLVEAFRTGGERSGADLQVVSVRTRFINSWIRRFLAPRLSPPARQSDAFPCGAAPALP